MAFNFRAIVGLNSAQFDSGISRVNKSMANFQKGAQRVGKGMSQVGVGVRGATIATAPFAAGVAAATMTAANFEAQMSTVGSVMLKTPEEMAAVTAVAKQLGATTQFSAIQAAEGAEFLARAGMSTTQIVSALGGVLDAAASSGVSLAEASDVVAGQLGAFGLAADQAGKVADTFALTTALTNTNFTQLAEAMKFAAPVANQAGMSLQSTAAAMGVLANAGIKGSLAGTALKNALIKLSKPSKEAVAVFGGKEGFNKAILETVNVAGKLTTRVRPMEVVMANMAEAISKSENPLEATRKAAEIFGIRGAAAFSSFQAQMTETVKLTSIPPDRLKAIQAFAENAGISLQEELGTGSINKLKLLRLSLEVAEGSASKMAKLKMDNVKGQFILLQSAVEGFMIETGALLQGPLKSGIKVVTELFSGLALGFQIVASGAPATAEQMNKSFAGIKFQDFLDFAQGFMEGFKEVKETAKDVFDSVSGYLKSVFGGTGMTAKEIGKIAVKIIAVGAIAAPVLGAIAAGLFVLGPIITGIVGIFNVVVGVISMVGSVIGVLWGIAQTVFGAIAVVAGAVSLPILAIIAAVVAVGAAIYIWRDEIVRALTTVWNFFKFGVGIVLAVWDEIVDATRSVWSPILDFFAGIFHGIASIAGKAINAIVDGLSWVASTLMGIFKTVGSFIFDALTFPLRSVMSLVKGVISKIAGTAIGRKALSIAGLDPEQMNSMLASLPGVETLDKSFGIKEPATGLGTEGIKQKAITKSPSAAENAAALTEAQRANPQQVNVKTSGSQNVKVTVEGKISGNDLNLVQTKAQINQAERNGRTLAPSAKRKMLANGQQATGG